MWGGESAYKLPPSLPSLYGARSAQCGPGHGAQAGGRICSFGAMNQARPPPPPSASGIRSLPGSKIIWAKRWEVCARAFRGEGGEAGRAGCAGRGEVPSDSPAVVRTELTLLSFPLTAASTARKLNPVAAWSVRRGASALLRAIRAGVRWAEPLGMGPCGLLGQLSDSPAWGSHLDIPQDIFLDAFLNTSVFLFSRFGYCQLHDLSFPTLPRQPVVFLFVRC